jgi:transcriptional regulator with XRE-family HTH domain
MLREQVGRIRNGLGLSREQLAAECGLSADRLLDLEKPGGDRFTTKEQDLLRLYFGKKFRKVREQEGLSRQELAERVKLTVSTVKNWEDRAASA